jgi:hypothetical protein
VVVALVTGNGPLYLKARLFSPEAEASERTLTAEPMLTAGGTNKPDYSQETVSIFARIMGPDFSSDFRVLSDLLSRRGLGFPLRLVDSNATVSAFMLEAIEFCNELGVRLLIFPVTPHQFETYALYAVGKQLGLTILLGQPTGIGNLVVLRDGRGERVAVPDLLRKSLSTEVVAKHRSAFRTAVYHRREGLIPTYIENQKARDTAVARMGITRKIIAAVRWVFIARYPKAFGSLHFRESGRWIERIYQIAMPHYWSAVLRASLRAVATTTIPQGEFALFALHYEPERTVQPEGGNYDNQLRAVITARKLLSESVELLVKEHSSQSSAALRGWMGRSPLFYSILARLPNTTLIEGVPAAPELIRTAVCVYTITGTVGLEAALAGVPVFYFGRPWWEGLPGATYVGGTEPDGQLPHPQGSPSPTDVEAFLDFLYDCYLFPGFALDGSSKLSQKIFEALARELP